LHANASVLGVLVIDAFIYSSPFGSYLAVVNLKLIADNEKDFLSLLISMSYEL